METKDRWQQGLAIAELAVMIAGILLYSQLCGFAQPWQFLGFLVGLGILALWVRLSRVKLRRQLAVVLLLAAYASFVPMLLGGEVSRRVFFFGMMLPTTVFGAAIYFGALRRVQRKRPLGPPND
ncbi:hypothetical protein GCM10027285_28690 [Oleiagrimonas citrea]|uniref:Uncharacterized protein n=1 Tax=Oleiagrimonas citrea TaxID=1665687 RepID=A0A846ZP27_9GAMM|nr:hypothetical protein [Oleiagrimonas citrea]NKZ39203.1 hypothetical protein [Oleiagrimonas citrea]